MVHVRLLALGGAALLATAALAEEPPPERAVTTPFVIFGYNDLGMHCMNPDFSEMLILPPFNTMHAQVIDRREGEPDIVDSDVTVRYTIPGNARSSDKSNFWRYMMPLLGAQTPADVGLAGKAMAGTLTPTGNNDFAAVGIPVTPADDSGRENAYPFAVLTVTQGSLVRARTVAVLPVSTEISCFLCHNTPGISTATDILQAHDRLHGTTLEQQKPVLCAGCHADNALGAPGQPGVSNFSAAMHASHATRMDQLSPLVDACYACHPGVRTQCFRDVHLERGMTCTDCHGDVAAVGNPARNPWVDEPRCGTCHTRAGFDFEQPGKLYRDSKGHGNVHCYACHGSPHAITPTVTEVDNLQAVFMQGHPGRIDTCTVCHSDGPPDDFFHSQDD